MDIATRKMLRLATSEKYKVKRMNDTSFEVISNDLSLKAAICAQGVIIQAKDSNYRKADLYKLQNFCDLMVRCHNIPHRENNSYNFI